jgi:2'-5' RNA ligase
MLVIFAKLDLTAKDAAWIEEVRRLRDPQAGLVPAHFTLVFPHQGLETADVLDHARAAAASTAPIAFHLSSAVAVRDPLAPRSLVFLTPDVGAAAIVALHDRLYEGPLARFLRHDLPYAPHVTVAAMEAHGDAETLATALGPIDIRGRIAALTLVSLEDGVLNNQRHLPLGGAA